MVTQNFVKGKSGPVRWLGDLPEFGLGTTFGVPWSQGVCSPSDSTFVCKARDGRSIPLQTRIIGYWPDGSIKWTAHSLPGDQIISDQYSIYSIDHSYSEQDHVPYTPLKVLRSRETLRVDTGKIVVDIPSSGTAVMRKLASTATGRILGENGRLTLLTQDTVSNPDESSGSIPQHFYESQIDSTVIENEGPIRVVVLVQGKHKLHLGNSEQRSAQSETWLPFALRLYLYSGSELLRVTHTIIYDGDASTSFIRGIGLRFDVPMHGTELYDRHVRFSGVDNGIFGEAIQGVTGLWRDPGALVRQAQIEGRPTPATSEWDAEFRSLLRWVPSWNDYSLTQLSPDGFTLKKRTKPGQSWVNIPGGCQAGGLVYLGSSHHGGLAVASRYFWERYPTSIDVRNAAKEDGQITLWLYSPAAEPMDLRPYHDGLHQVTYEDQLQALKITYEDWEAELGSPYGIARTNEICIFGLDETPTHERLSHLTRLCRNPPVLVPDSDYIRQTRALGTYWSTLSADNSSAHKPSSSDIKSIDERLAFLFNFYRDQIRQRRWWGFWDHGDIMHTYDRDRHTWRYDVGGYAWDNSELSPDLWLWLYFLRTGREDVYRIAEALTRHTSEVDAYHIGPFKGLGTRHGVQHWSDSCKQARVSNALYKRIFYFLSGGDERTGDLLEETLDSTATLIVLDPYRKVRKDKNLYVPRSDALSISLGTDWSAMASSWFIEWERRGLQWKEAKRRLLESMKGIVRLKNGFVTGSALYNLASSTINPPIDDLQNDGMVSISHLSAMFGLVEICAELIDTVGLDLPPGFERTWLEYCQYFNASPELQKERFGKEFGSVQLRQGHSRLTAYAATKLDDRTLAHRAWNEFLEDSSDGYGSMQNFEITIVSGSKSHVPVSEAPWVSTNTTALYGLAAIQNLAFLNSSINHA